MPTPQFNPETEKEVLKTAISTFREQIVQCWDFHVIHAFYDAVGRAEDALTIFEHQASEDKEFQFQVLCLKTLLLVAHQDIHWVQECASGESGRRRAAEEQAAYPFPTQSKIYRH
jgi:hypothetical protein